MLRTRIYSKVSYAASTYQKNWPLNSTNARMTMRPGQWEPNGLSINQKTWWRIRFRACTYIPMEFLILPKRLLKRYFNIRPLMIFLCGQPIQITHPTHEPCYNIQDLLKNGTTTFEFPPTPTIELFTKYCRVSCIVTFLPLANHHRSIIARHEAICKFCR